MGADGDLVVCVMSEEMSPRQFAGARITHESYHWPALCVRHFSKAGTHSRYRRKQFTVARAVIHRLRKSRNHDRSPLSPGMWPKQCERKPNFLRV
jgi:hypothetical protein